MGLGSPGLALAIRGVTVRGSVIRGATFILVEPLPVWSIVERLPAWLTRRR